MGLIEDSREWLAIRELRNLAAHEYMEDNLTRYFQLLKENTPKILQIQKILEYKE